MTHASFGAPARPVLVRADRSHVWDRHDRRYLDATAGAFCVNLGYTRPDLVAAMTRAAERLPFARASAFDSDAAEAYRAALLAEAGPPFARVLLTSSGSEAVEAAMKLAVAYQAALGRPERTAIRSLAGHYHGATVAALAATGWEARRAPYAAMLGERRDGLPHPGDGSAALLAETVPTAGLGVRVPAPADLAARRAACDAAGALWIADEVLTGFGRCGALFAWQRIGEGGEGAEARAVAVPDLVVFGKGAGAGFAPLAGVLVAAPVADALEKGAAERAIAHFQTYGGNPIGCAVGRAVLEALRTEACYARARGLERPLREAVGAAGLGGVSGVESLGALVGFDSPERAADYARRGLLVHQAEGARCVLAPPLAFEESDLAELRERLGAAATFPRGR